ncbi:MAG: potassium-transporting ATPase subunit F [Candidatus Sumerlaeia bacterium]|nr:potassium-transporting ATPase subunit F [Candidatus Sumerlaeia bacterium]
MSLMTMLFLAVALLLLGYLAAALLKPEWF